MVEPRRDDDPARPIVKRETEVRQGREGKPVRNILLISAISAVIALGIVYLVFVLMA